MSALFSCECFCLFTGRSHHLVVVVSECTLLENLVGDRGVPNVAFSLLCCLRSDEFFAVPFVSISKQHSAAVISTNVYLSLVVMTAIVQELARNPRISAPPVERALNVTRPTRALSRIFSLHSVVSHETSYTHTLWHSITLGYKQFRRKGGFFFSFST